MMKIFVLGLDLYFGKCAGQAQGLCDESVP